MVQRGCINNFVKEINYNHGSYRGGGRGGYIGSRGNNNQKVVREGEQRQQKNSPGVVRGVINTIVSGFTGGGYTNSTIKRHVQALKSVNVGRTDDTSPNLYH